LHGTHNCVIFIVEFKTNAMITRDRQLTDRLTREDVRIIMKNLDATEDWYWHEDSTSRPEMKELSIWNMRQKRFISQILASLAETLSSNLRMIKRLDAGTCSQALDLPEEFMVKVKNML